MSRSFIRITGLLICLLSFQICANAQFKEEAFSQNYNSSEVSDTAEAKSMFSFKEYFRGLSHKDTLKIGTLFAGSAVFVGGQQIYHKQYWKLPIIYGGIGAGVGLGLHYKNIYNNSSPLYNATINPDDPWCTNTKANYLGNAFLAGGVLMYWASLMDGAITFKSDISPQPGRSTIYSLLVPGLGQIYNGEPWKVPVYWGCLIGAYHFWNMNKSQFMRFKNIYLQATNTEVQYTGPISAENAKYYRDIYRRYRDYSLLALAGFYLLQAIDANVFAYMQDFEVSDDLSMHVSPTVITPCTQYAMMPNSVGMSVGFRF